MKQRLHSCHLSLRPLQSCAIASSYKAMNTRMIFPYDCNYCAREVYRSAYIVLNGSCISHRFDHLPQYSQHACIIHVQSYRQSFDKHINYQFSQTHWFPECTLHPYSHRILPNMYMNITLHGYPINVVLHWMKDCTAYTVPWW